MAESDGRNPVRIVYHAENRTFARLFNEHSLEQVKNVVRLKLGLGQETDVSLKQMIGTHAPLDLEDEADFQAFRVFLKSTTSVDVHVTVGRSQGSMLVVPKPSASEPTTLSSSVPSREHVEPAKTTKTPSTVARKRRVSFDSTVTGLDKPAESHTPRQPVAVSTSKTTAGPPAIPQPATEEPPTKRRKKESTKTTAEAVESPATKTPAKPKVKKSTTSDRGSKVVPKDVETTEAPVKKARRKKDDSTTLKKSSAAEDVPDQPIVSHKTSLQPADRPLHSSTEGSTSNTLQAEKPLGVCASIPQTSESIILQSEVAAAILAKASKIKPTEPPPKRKSVRKVTKKPSASPMETTPANDLPGEQTLDLDGPLCPICLGAPFHIRYCCPTVLKGPDAIRERLDELYKINKGDHQSLIKQLEDLLRDPKVTLLDTAPPDGVQSRRASLPPVPRTPNIPTNSCLSEVTVESKDEGSSSESSGDTSEGAAEPQDLSTSRRQKMPDERLSPNHDDLQAVISGPAPDWQSILDIMGDEDDTDDEDEDEAKLEEDPDEETGRSRRRSSMHDPSPSESGSEEESRSPSPSCSADDSSNDLQPGGQGVAPAGASTARQDGDVIMRDSVDPSVLEGRDDDSSETHVCSEGHMVVDKSIGEADGAAVAVAAGDSTPRASVLPPSSVPVTELQESGTAKAGSVLNQNGTVSVAPEVPKEVEADPIEPSDGLESPVVSRSSDADPIEASSEGIRSVFAHSTPKPGVSKRIKTRNGHLPDDEADRPVLVGQLTPLLSKGKSRTQLSETSASQESAPARKSPWFNSLPPSTSTPVAMVLLNHRGKGGKAIKTPAKRSQERLDASQSSTKDGAAQGRASLAATPSLTQWETMAEPPLPAAEVDEPSVPVDELMPGSPPATTIHVRERPKGKEKNGRTRKSAASSQAGGSQGKERLFDLSSSQTPFPYSQHQTNPAPPAVTNGNKSDGTSDLDEEPKVIQKSAKPSTRYRPLSQLASEATHFSPSLPTPTNKSYSMGKSKKRPADEDSSSSSSSSDADEANGSEHIPRGRRAGSALETKKKRSLLSKI